MGVDNVGKLLSQYRTSLVLITGLGIASGSSLFCTGGAGTGAGAGAGAP